MGERPRLTDQANSHPTPISPQAHSQSPGVHFEFLFIRADRPTKHTVVCSITLRRAPPLLAPRITEPLTHAPVPPVPPVTPVRSATWTISDCRHITSTRASITRPSKRDAQHHSRASENTVRSTARTLSSSFNRQSTIPRWQTFLIHIPILARI